MHNLSSSGGEFLAKTLAAYGVSHVFFVDAILRHALAHMEDLGIRRILTHSEKAAAYMADGFARMARRPAVCMAQSVGAANLAAGLQDAFFAGSPVVALTGRHIAPYQYRNAYQELDHAPLFSAVSKFTGRIDTREQVAHLLQRAFHLACTDGPVHLDVAGHTGSVMDYWNMPADLSADDHLWCVPVQHPRPDPQILSQVIAAIRQAQRPLLVAGIGVHWSRAEAVLRQFVAHAQIPLASTLDAKHVLTDDDPCNIGVIGTYGTDAANKLAAEADLILFIGCDTGDQATANWGLAQQGTAVIQIDIDARVLGINHPQALCLHADPQAALTDLCAQDLPSAARAPWLQRLRALREAWQNATHAMRHAHTVPVRPERICEEIGAWLPEDAVFVTDTGYASQWAAQMLRMTSVRQTFLRAAGSLGWGFPAALGAKAAAPDRPVICFTGDGGFMYHLSELETARRWNLNTITIVNNNGQLAQGLKNLKLAYTGRTGRMEDCYRFRRTDFAKLAEVFDCVGISVQSPEALHPALQTALTAEKPVVIDVQSDPQAQAPIPWMPASRVVLYP